MSSRKTYCALTVFFLVTSLSIVFAPIYAQSNKSKKSECTTESGKHGNWKYYSHWAGLELEPLAFTVPGIEKLKPVQQSYFKDSIQFKFSVIKGEPEFMLFVNALKNPSPDLGLGAFIGGESVMPPIHASDAGGVAGSYIDGDVGRELLQNFSKRKGRVDFVFATFGTGTETMRLKIGMELKGFSDALVRAKKLHAKTAAAAKRGDCAPNLLDTPINHWLQKK